MSGAQLSFVLQIVNSCLSIPDLLSRTQICKSVIEPPPSVVEALVCHRQPFNLIIQHFVAARAQHP